MKKYLVFIICLVFTVAHANFLDSIFGHKSKHRKQHATSSVPVSIDYTKETKIYTQYCQSESTTYGFKVTCNLEPDIVPFKASASATVKCVQMVNGVNNSYPATVSISKEFISSLKLCKGNVYGPNTIQKSIIEPRESEFISKHISTTYYDVVCGSSGYESMQYIVQQNVYTEQNNKTIAQCQELNAPEPKKFIVMFYICIGLALISLLIIIYQKYRRKLK